MWASVFHTFWPVIDPLVAVAHRPAGQAGEVGAGAGLAEELAPGVLAGEHPAQQPLPQRVVAVGHDRRAGHGEPEELAGVVGPAAPGLAGAGRRRAAGRSGATPRPPQPSGKWTQARPRSNCTAPELDGVGGLRVELVEQLVDPLLHENLWVTHGGFLLPSVAATPQLLGRLLDGDPARPPTRSRLNCGSSLASARWRVHVAAHCAGDVDLPTFATAPDPTPGEEDPWPRP